MKGKYAKEILLVGILLVLICAVAFFYFGVGKEDSATIESREALLEEALAKGSGWKIATEITLDDYIVSGAYSADDQLSLAVFEPLDNGKYKFTTSTNRNSGEIVIGGATINGAWYDLIWFNGAQTAYAEITYTVNGQSQDPIRYDTKDMGIIYHPAPAADYLLHVCYVDHEGNRYE